MRTARSRAASFATAAFSAENASSSSSIPAQSENCTQSEAETVSVSPSKTAFSFSGRCVASSRSSLISRH